MILTPTTELEAVNTMLSIIGESPISSLENTELVDAVTARTILRAVSREVQSRSWHWNTEENYRLLPNTQKEIVLPLNTLRVDTDNRSQHIDVIQRAQRLYNKGDHTFRFNQPVTVTLVLNLPFEEIPETARRFITLRAGRIFQERMVGSDMLSSFSALDENQAWALLMDAEAETADINLLNSDAVGRILRR